MNNNDKLWTTNEEINVLEKLLEELYRKQRELLKNKGNQSWWDYLLELIGY